jgi:hypothetical protein
MGSDQKAESAGDRKRSSRRRAPSVVELVRRASAEFSEVTGADVESVSGVETTEDGWQIQLETVEVARIPDTTSVLASYRVRLDTDGELIGYSRIRRYARGQLDQ